MEPSIPATGVVDFLQPILDEYLSGLSGEYHLLLRGDSGFRYT